MWRCCSTAAMSLLPGCQRNTNTSQKLRDTDSNMSAAVKRKGDDLEDEMARFEAELAGFLEDDAAPGGEGSAGYVRGGRRNEAHSRALTHLPPSPFFSLLPLPLPLSPCLSLSPLSLTQEEQGDSWGAPATYSEAAATYSAPPARAAAASSSASAVISAPATYEPHPPAQKAPVPAAASGPYGGAPPSSLSSSSSSAYPPVRGGPMSSGPPPTSAYAHQAYYPPQGMPAGAEAPKPKKHKPTREAGGEKWHDEVLESWDPSKSANQRGGGGKRGDVQGQPAHSLSISSR